MSYVIIEILHRFAMPHFKGRAAGVLESALMAVPIQVTMNTSATPMYLCVNESIGSICLNSPDGARVSLSRSHLVWPAAGSGEVLERGSPG